MAESLDYYTLEIPVGVIADTNDSNDLRGRAEHLRYVADELDSRAARIEESPGQ